MRPRVAVTHRGTSVPHLARVQLIQIDLSLRFVDRDCQRGIAREKKSSERFHREKKIYINICIYVILS